MGQMLKIQYGAKAENTGGPHTWWAGSKYMVGRPAVGDGGGAFWKVELQRPPQPPRQAGPPLDPAHHICGPPVFPAFAPYRIVFSELPKGLILMAQRHSGFRPPRHGYQYGM